MYNKGLVRIKKYVNQKVEKNMSLKMMSQLHYITGHDIKVNIIQYPMTGVKITPIQGLFASTYRE
jgi:hypothetical protein